jgi:hypothetical protein
LFWIQFAASSMSALLVLRPSSLRSMFSIITFKENGSRETLDKPFFSAACSE